MRKFILLMAVICFATLTQAQYYYLPPVNTGSNPGGLNNDDEFPLGGGLPAGWVGILGPSQTTPAWSSVETIPFTFNFNGAPVTQYKVSSTGVLTFTTTATTVPGTSNAALPSASIPDNSIMAWGINGSGTNDNIATKTFGTAPNRQHWVFFTSYSYPGLNGWNYFSIVLEEGTDKIYVVDQRSNQQPTTSVNLTVGVQIDGTTAVQDINSPNVHTNTSSSLADRSDNYYWEFFPGTQPDFDLAMVSLDIAAFPLLSDGPFDIEGQLTNLGAQTITSFNLNYSVDGGSVVTDTISGVSITSLQNFNYMSVTSWSPTMPGDYSIEVWISDLNGANPDENGLNDTIMETRFVADEFTERNALHEVFTSSSCGPCAPGNANTASVFSASPETPVILKYQMSWPGSGDPYYTLEGNARRTYYGVNSVPNMFVDGGWDGNTNSYTGVLLQDFSDIPAFMEVDGNFTVTGNTIDINFSLLPLIDFSGNNVLHVAVIENVTTQNVSTNGETSFDNVMKKMLPNANGTAIPNLRAGESRTFNYNYTFNGNFRLPPNANSPIDHATEHSVEEFTDLNFVVFVQNSSTKEVYHASFGTPQATSIDLAIIDNTVPDNVNVNAATPITGQVLNTKATQITSFDLVYTINNGLPQTESITGLALNQGDTYNFTHTNNWTPTIEGFYKLDIQIENVNGIAGSDDLEFNNRAFKFVSVNSPTGIPSYDVAKTVSIYPNPATDQVFVRTLTGHAKTLEIFSLVGEKVEQIHLGKSDIYELNTSKYNRGVYILRFTSQAGTFSERLVIE